MTLLVRDEEDILDANLRYHFAAGVDFVIATDNLSVDRTPEILRVYEREGRLQLLEQRGDNYDQSRWVTRMARLAASEHRADWVINSDADEFWWPGSGSLKGVLEAVPMQRGAVSAARTNFAPRPPTNEPFFRTMTIRERVSLTVAGRPPLNKICHRAYPDAVVAQGNHALSRRRVLRPRRVIAGPVPITIFHFPVRAYPQFENKIRKGGAAVGRNRRLAPSVNRTWRMLHELLLRGELETYYESLVLDDAAAARGLADGTLVYDERLRAVLDELYSNEPR